MELSFKGKTAVITGASQGLGACVAKAYAAAGAKTVVHYRSRPEPAAEVVEDIVKMGGQAIAVSAHLDNPDDVQRLFAATQDAFGSVDVLVNNAGSFPNASLFAIELDDWKKMYADNVESTFLCTKAAAQIMQEAGGGAIVNVASTSALNPGADHSHYNSAKSAVVMFTQSTAQELGRFNIRVNAVAPGLIYRPGLEEQWPDGFQRYLKSAPLACVVQPEDVANACLFLSSESATRITGTTLPVDAGVLTAMAY